MAVKTKDAKTQKVTPISMTFTLKEIDEYDTARLRDDFKEEGLDLPSFRNEYAKLITTIQDDNTSDQDRLHFIDGLEQNLESAAKQIQDIKNNPESIVFKKAASDFAYRIRVDKYLDGVLERLKSVKKMKKSA